MECSSTGACNGRKSSLSFMALGLKEGLHRVQFSTSLSVVPVPFFCRKLAGSPPLFCHQLGVVSPLGDAWQTKRNTYEPFFLLQLTEHRLWVTPPEYAANDGDYSLVFC